MNSSALSFSLVLVLCISSAISHKQKPSCHQRCPVCPQRFAPCKFGEEFNFCNCCTTCLKGEGEICDGPGGVNGKCADGLFCQLEGTTKVCRPNNIICFVPCSEVTCPPRPVCRFGYGKDICGCCDICLQGPGQSCGGFSKCGRGLDCDDSVAGGICIPRIRVI